MFETKVILVTEASAGLGRLTANALAQSGHTVYAAVPDGGGGINRRAIREIKSYAREQGVNLRPLDLDTSSDAGVDDALQRIRTEHAQLDVLVNYAPRLLFGPAEAFPPDQIARAFEQSVIGTQRLMRAALPVMRGRSEGLVVWIVGSAAAGGTPPYLAFHCAIQAALEAVATQYARELTRWGIETAIIVPGFLSPDDPLRHACEPDDMSRVADYENGPYFGLSRTVRDRVERLVQSDAIAGAAAGAVAMIVDTPFGERPFRITVDPSNDGAEVVFSVLDRIRNEMIRRLGMADLLKASSQNVRACAAELHKT